MRTLLRPEDDIQHLEDAQDCSVEPGGNMSKRVEIHVGKGLSLHEVIHSIYPHGYDGQVKVVSRDSIIQTSQAEYNPSEQEHIFVLPGDLVFIEPRD